MKTTGLTLSEALSTGRPFKHVYWADYITKDTFGKIEICREQFWDSNWQVKEEEKPSMRVWRRRYYGTHVPINMCVIGKKTPDENEWEDITETLAAALAPLIKKELGL